MNSCGGTVDSKTPCSSRPGRVRQPGGVAVGVGLGATRVGEAVKVGGIGVGEGGVSFAEQAETPAAKRKKAAMKGIA